MAPEELTDEGWPVPEPEGEAVPPGPEEAKIAPASGESAFLLNLLSAPPSQALSPPAAPPAWAQGAFPPSLPDGALGLNREPLLRFSLAQRDLEMIFLAHRVG